MEQELEGLISPQPLTSEHNLSRFGCGVQSLDTWLRRHALTNQASGYSKTYVVCADVTDVVGYYALTASAVARAEVGLGQDAPKLVPVVLLGRIAVHTRYQGRGLGQFLLRDALLRVREAADTVGVRAVLVHALTPVLAGWYKSLGFVALPADPLALMLPLQNLSSR